MSDDSAPVTPTIVCQDPRREKRLVQSIRSIHRKEEYRNQIDAAHRVLSQKLHEYSGESQCLAEKFRAECVDSRRSNRSQLPRLQLGALRQRSKDSLVRPETSSLTSRDVQDHPWGVPVDGFLTDRQLRREWLQATEPLTKMNLLSPYAVKQPVTPRRCTLSSPELAEEENTVRVESKRISSALRQLNVAVRTGGRGIGSSRSSRLDSFRDLSHDINAVAERVSTIVESMGTVSARSHRFDFISANKSQAVLGLEEFRRAKALRQSVESVDKMESAWTRNLQLQTERSLQVVSAISRRDETRQSSRNKSQLGLQDLTKSWIAHVLAAKFVQLLMVRLRSHASTKVRSAVKIQRAWRLYTSVERIQVMRSMAVIGMWMRTVIKQYRRRRLHIAADKIRTFLLESQSYICICHAVPSFLKFKMKVRDLQKIIREFLDNLYVLRVKFLAHFEKTEDIILRGLLREQVRQSQKNADKNAASDTNLRRASKAPVGDTAGREHDATRRMSRFAPVQDARIVDWSSISDLNRFRTPDELKKAIVAWAVRRHRLAFIDKRVAWKAEMKEYKVRSHTFPP